FVGVSLLHHVCACSYLLFSCVFFFDYTAPTEIYTLSLHDALPILRRRTMHPTRARSRSSRRSICRPARSARRPRPGTVPRRSGGDRKSTRLNSSHVKISYAVFCLKKKKAK